jgi:asparagine synthase (glutamine-hydrolysing)
MCGITGFFTNKKGLSRPEMQAMGRGMNEAVRHRGPDGHDTWQDPDVNLLLGHRRLAIIDLSAEGAQPKASHSQRYMMSFNGEIYNYLDIKAELERAGISFRGRSDTEVLLASIEYFGLNFTLQKINGMFAFALWDRKDKILHLVRDRFGKKPLSVGWAGKYLVFGSELKALRAHPDFAGDMNPDSRALYMKFGYIPAPHCIYKNTWSLPAGHRLSLDTDSLIERENLSERMEPYWNHLTVLEDARGKMDDRKTDAEAVEEFSELLNAAVRDRLMSDVPLGAFLSGGIDSSAVVATMQSLTKRPVKTYTIGFHESGFDEAAHAKKIANHLGTDHHELYLNAKDALDVIPKLPDIYDEPFADMSAIPTYLVSKFARQGVTVALSGDGGDEMLGGYTRHTTAPKIWARAKMLPRPVRKLVARGLQAISVETWDSYMPGKPQAGSAVHKAAAILSLESEGEIYNRLAGQGADEFLLSEGAAETILEKYQPRDLSFAETMMFRDALFYLPGDILVKVDRASMTCSLEARAPLLDMRIYDYAWSLAPRFKIRNGKGKWLLRQVLKKHMPDEYFERPKQGFAVPAGEWLKGPLKDWAESLLTPVKLGEDFDEATIKAAWQAHLDGRGNHAGKLWTLLMFQAWKERWL